MAGATGTPPTPAAGADGKPDPNAKPDPKTGDPGTDAGDDGYPADLGEAGRKALRAERAARDKAERERDAATRERDELKARTQTAEEKALDEAKAQGRSEATTDANRRIVRSEIRAAAAAKVSDPEDAAHLLGDLDRFIVKDEVDSKAISAAIADLVKAKPYLAPAGRAKALPGGGATQSTGTSFNDEIRRRIRGG